VSSGYLCVMDAYLDPRSPGQREREDELLSELRSSFLFLVCIMGILLFVSVLGLALS
jgi:hypothetical protein